MDRRSFLQWSAASAVALPWGSRVSGAARRRPNFIVVLCDDLGYGDIYRRSFTELSGRGYPQLYDMSADEAEDYSMAAHFPEVLADMQARLERARQTFAPLKSKELPEPWRSTRQGK